MIAKQVQKSLKAYKDYEGIKDKVNIRLLTELEFIKEMSGKNRKI